MKQTTIILIGTLLIISSCIRENGEIKGTWISSDFTSPSFLTFTETHWIDYTFGLDSFPYYLHHDSIFLQAHFKPELLRFGYKISKDTLWTTFPGDTQTQKRKYLKSKSPHYIDDINSHLGIKLKLPTGYSNLVGLRFGNSIYLPEQNVRGGQYRIFVNNEQIVLDSLLHEKLFKLPKHDELPKHYLFGLYIDLKTEYGAVKLLKDELRKAGFYKVAFISNPSAEKYYESNVGLQKTLLPIFENDNVYINPNIRKIVDERSPPYHPSKYYFSKPDFNKPNICKVEIIDNETLLNDQKLNKKILYEMMKENNPHIAYLYVNGEVKYETYYSFISLYDSLKLVVKNEKSLELYKREYNELTDVEKIENIYKLSTSELIER